MPAVDVVVSRRIEAPVEVVSAFAGDPGNAPRWYANISSAQWLTDPPVRVGSQVRFVAAFLGRRLEYTYEVVELVPQERLVMRTAQGPFPMETTYAWEQDGEATRMTLRNRGEPHGFSAVAAPVMAAAMRRATSKDLERLAAVLETQPG